MRPEDFDRIRRMAREVEKLRPTLEQMESIHRQTEGRRKWLADPKVQEGMRRQMEAARQLGADPAIQQAQAEARRIFEQRNWVYAQMPDPATQKALVEAARYFNSPEFQAQRDAVLQAARAARQYLGPEGLAAAGRIASRRSSSSESQEPTAERVREGQAATILEEATKLAAKPEVRETIQAVDSEALLRLDEEQRAQEGASESEGVLESGPVELEDYRGELTELSKEDLIKVHDQALLLLLPLQAVLAIGLSLRRRQFSYRSVE
jgi:hypothetical protein